MGYERPFDREVSKSTGLYWNRNEKHWDKVTIRRTRCRIVIDADANEIEIKLDGRPQCKWNQQRVLRWIWSNGAIQLDNGPIPLIIGTHTRLVKIKDFPNTIFHISIISSHIPTFCIFPFRFSTVSFTEA